MNAYLKANKILQELNFDFSTFQMDRFLRFVGERKGREIISIPIQMPGSIFGAWISDNDEPKEYIFYRDNVPVLHQVHIQLHELSHFLLGHPTLRFSEQLIIELTKKRGPIPLEDITQLRSKRNNQIEMEAETLTNLIQQKVVRYTNLTNRTFGLSSDVLTFITHKIYIQSALITQRIQNWYVFQDLKPLVEHILSFFSPVGLPPGNPSFWQFLQNPEHYLYNATVVIMDGKVMLDEFLLEVRTMPKTLEAQEQEEKEDTLLLEDALELNEIYEAIPASQDFFEMLEYYRHASLRLMKTRSVKDSVWKLTVR